MTTVAEDHHNAQQVLGIYAHFDSKPGDELFANNFIPVAARRNIAIRDLQNGLDDAVRLGWLEETPDGYLRLTQLGYQNM